MTKLPTTSSPEFSPWKIIGGSPRSIPLRKLPYNFATQNSGNDEKGFTLVELSIVLVIIGLLIGGILAAQSMINTAKIQALVRQVGQFDAAVENFQTKYQQLPGDTNLMGASLGNNDGIVTDGGTNDYYVGEILKFWADLSKSGFMNPSGQPYVDVSDTNALPNGNFKSVAPQAPLGDSNNVIMAIGSPASGKNYYMITSFFVNPPDLVLNQGGNPVFKPADVLAFDTKTDDGLANSGNVSGWDAYGVQASRVELPTVNGNGCTVNGGSAYAVSSSTELCSIRIRIGTTTGDLK